MRATATATRSGWAVLISAVVLAGVAVWSGNNLLYMVAAPIWAMVLIAWPVGQRHLAGIQVRRALPPEIYAEHDAPGTLWLRAPAGWGHLVEVDVHDEGAGARAHLSRLGRGRWLEVRVRWRFGRRGRASLTAVTVTSTFPFGLLRHRRRVELAAEVLVYPHPLSGGPTSRRPGDGEGEHEVGRGGAGDIVELRDYHPGDAPRRIHWPTSARVGQPMVVERHDERVPVVMVRVRAASGVSAWERELSRACTEILRAFSVGHAVGLVVPDLGAVPAQTLRAARGAPWRRHLLDTLARLPREAR